MHPDILTVCSAAEDLLELTEPPEELPEFLYAHLSQCILSAVYSISNTATSERRTVQDYVDFANLYPQYRPGRQLYLPTRRQQPLDEFAQDMERLTPPVFAQAVLHNMQRTSARGRSILKAEASYSWATILLAANVHYLQDMLPIMDDPDFEQAIRSIPGQRSRISLVYFYMLCGSERHVKPDRRVVRFLERTLGRSVDIREVAQLLTGAAFLLHDLYPHITPRVLDNLIWQYESERSR